MITTFFLASNFASGLSGWYAGYASWSFALLDYAVTGGADTYLRAVFASPTVIINSI